MEHGPRICEIHDEICAGSGGLCNTVEVISRAVPPSQEDPLGAFDPTSREGDGPGFMEHYLWRRSLDVHFDEQIILMSRSLNG